MYRKQILSPIRLTAFAQRCFAVEQTVYIGSPKCFESLSGEPLHRTISIEQNWIELFQRGVFISVGVIKPGRFRVRI